MKFRTTIDGQEVVLRTVSDYSINEWSKYLKEREGFVGFHNPDIKGSDGNLTDVFPEGTPFTIKAGEFVTARTEQGEGEMVIVTVETPEGDKRLSIWGAYLLAQVKDAEPSDYPTRVVIKRGPVEGFSQRPDTKRFAPADGE